MDICKGIEVFLGGVLVLMGLGLFVCIVFLCRAHAKQRNLPKNHVYIPATVLRAEPLLPGDASMGYELLLAYKTPDGREAQLLKPVSIKYFRDMLLPDRKDTIEILYNCDDEDDIRLADAKRPGIVGLVVAALLLGATAVVAIGLGVWMMTL